MKHEQREFVAGDLPRELVGVNAELTTTSGAAQCPPAKAVSHLVLRDPEDVGGLVLRQRQPRSAAVAVARWRHRAAPR